MEGVSFLGKPGVDKSTSPPVDRALADLAGSQHGRVALWQLIELGLTRAAVSKRVAAGRLHRVHPGVYAVGHGGASAGSAYMSAVLACGRGAVLSHRSAAAHWGLRPSAGDRVDVTAANQRGRHVRGIAAHCSGSLHPRDVTTFKNIPCTTVARTLVDLADVVHRRSLERAVEEADELRLFDGRQVHDVLVRSNGRRGAPALESILATYEEPEVSDRELERKFLEVCRRAGLERPLTQVGVELADGDTVFVDFLWPQSKLIVETDGRQTHGTRRAFERDRRRDRRLMLLGYRVARFTWLDVGRRPDEVARTIAALRAQ